MYREKKATQAAAEFMRLTGNRRNYMELLKLLYLMDRTALKQWGHPVTHDGYAAMELGPILSKTYDRIKSDPPGSGYWNQFIRTSGYDVVLVEDPSNDELSEAESDLIASVFETYGRMSRRELVDHCHGFSEWIKNKPPKKSSCPISYSDVLRSVGRTESEVHEMTEDMEYYSGINRTLKSA